MTRRRRAMLIVRAALAAALLLAAASARSDADVVTEARIDAAQRARVARAIAEARRAAPPVPLTKEALRVPMHALVPLLRGCYEEIARSGPADGVINTRFLVDSLAGRGTIFTVRGFDTVGALGRSQRFRDCVKRTAEAAVLPPIGAGGSADITYPITFAATPPDNRRTELPDRAAAAAAAGRWAEALEAAERGLEVTSLDGTYRRRLIAIAGVAACHLGRIDKAEHYRSLASATFEAEIRQACAHDAGHDAGDRGRGAPTR